MNISWKLCFNHLIHEEHVILMGTCDEGTTFHVACESRVYGSINISFINHP